MSRVVNPRRYSLLNKELTFSLPFREGSGLGLFFEINEAYGPQLSAMLSGLGYTDIQIHKDIYGKDRIIEARMAR